MDVVKSSSDSILQMAFVLQRLNLNYFKLTNV